MDKLDLQFDRADSAQSRNLIQQLDADLLARYPAEAIHGLHPNDITDPTLLFLVVRVGGAAVGCGALRRLEPSVGEVKRMYVRPDFRGRGISRQILSTLENKARELGYSILRLETGMRQPEAVTLYRSAGYAEIPPFGEYVGNAFSLCFEKRLS